MRAGPTRKAPNRMPAAISSAQSVLPMRRAIIRRLVSSRNRQGSLRGVPGEAGHGVVALVVVVGGRVERAGELVLVVDARAVGAERQDRGHPGQRAGVLVAVVANRRAVLVGAAVGDGEVE